MELSPIFMFLVVILIVSVKQINQYERGVKFRLGKYIGMMEPGWHIVYPLIEGFRKVDIRVNLL